MDGAPKCFVNFLGAWKQIIDVGDQTGEAAGVSAPTFDLSLGDGLRSPLVLDNPRSLTSDVRKVAQVPGKQQCAEVCHGEPPRVLRRNELVIGEVLQDVL